MPRGVPLSVAKEQMRLQATGNMGYVMQGALSQQLNHAVNDFHGRVSKQLQAMAQVFARPQTDQARRQQMHQQLGESAQQAVLDAYKRRVEARQSPASRTHYRKGATDNRKLRYAGGALRRALGSPQFFQATADGINFVNRDHLDKEAAHWHRLNFGAGPRGEGSFDRFEVRYGTLVVAAFGFDRGPSKAFRVPRGFWIDVTTGKRVARGAEGNKGNLAFYPGGERPPGVGGMSSPGRMSGGIVARHFLEEGLANLARNLPRAYDAYFKELWQEFLQGRGPLTNVQVSLSRPGRVSRSSRRLVNEWELVDVDENGFEYFEQSQRWVNL